MLKRKGRKACTSTTKLVKLTLISELNAATSTDSGFEKSYVPWTPAFRNRQSISGNARVTLQIEVSGRLGIDRDSMLPT